MMSTRVYLGDNLLEDVEVYPQHEHEGNNLNSDPELSRSKVAALLDQIREKGIRVNHFSQPSERCPPLSVLYMIGAAYPCLKIKSKTTKHGALHTCLRESKTAVMMLGEEELHLVAMNSREKNDGIKYFWGFLVMAGLYNSCARKFDGGILQLASQVVFEDDVICIPLPPNDDKSGTKSNREPMCFDEREEMNEDLKKKNAKLSQIEVQLKRKNDELKKKCEEIQEKNGEVEEKKEELKKKNAELTQIENQISVKNKELENMRGELKTKSGELKTKSDELDKKNDQLDVKSKELASKCQEVSEKNIELDNKNDELKVKGKELQSKCDEVRKKDEELEKKREEVRDINAELAELEKKKTAFGSEIEEVVRPQFDPAHPSEDVMGFPKSKTFFKLKLTQKCAVDWDLKVISGGKITYDVLFKPTSAAVRVRSVHQPTTLSLEPGQDSQISHSHKFTDPGTLVITVRNHTFRILNLRSRCRVVVPDV